MEKGTYIYFRTVLTCVLLLLYTNVSIPRYSKKGQTQGLGFIKMQHEIMKVNIVRQLKSDNVLWYINHTL